MIEIKIPRKVCEIPDRIPKISLPRLWSNKTSELLYDILAIGTLAVFATMGIVFYYLFDGELMFMAFAVMGIGGVFLLLNERFNIISVRCACPE